MKEEIRRLVEESETRAKAASRAPWKVETSGRFKAIVAGEERVAQISSWGGIKEEHDLNFTAHARQDVPALCAAIREIDQEKESLKGAWLDFYRASKSLDNDLGSDMKKREKLWERFGETRAALRALGVDI